MTEQASNGSLCEIFSDKMRAFGETHPDEEKRLSEELIYWGSFVIVGGETLWDLIESQIKYRVEKHQAEGHDITPEAFVDYLFEPNSEGEITADIVMGRLDKKFFELQFGGN